MGALKQTIKVREIIGEPMRYNVESWEDPAHPHTVDLAEAGGMGLCSCRDCATTVARNRKEHPGKWHCYLTLDGINPQRTECRHIFAAWLRHRMTTAPGIAKLLNEVKNK